MWAFLKVMQNEAPLEWDEDCQKASDKVKVYLTKPLVLANPINGKPLVLYITVLEHSLGPPLVHVEGKEMSHITSAEHWWVPKCGILPSRKCVWHSYLVSKSCSTISSTITSSWSQKRITWNIFSFLLQQYNTKYVLYKAIKGQAL